MKFDLINMGKKKFDPFEDSPSDIIGVDFDDESKNIELITSRFKYAIEQGIKPQEDDKPDIVFALFDTSESMREPISGAGIDEIVNPEAPEEEQWGFSSKYHHSLITYFMMIEKFKDMNIYNSDIYFANFSDDTYLSVGIDESKRQALHPQFGTTIIDVDKIRSVLESKQRRKKLLITLSDGEIFNKEAVISEITSHKNDLIYVHIQLGEKSDYCQAIEELGYLVKYINSENDLYNFVIDLIDRVYR